MCVLTLFAAKTTFACNNLFDKAANYIKTAKNYLLTFTRCSFKYLDKYPKENKNTKLQSLN